MNRVSEVKHFVTDRGLGVYIIAIWERLGEGSAKDVADKNSGLVWNRLRNIRTEVERKANSLLKSWINK